MSVMAARKYIKALKNNPSEIKTISRYQKIALWRIAEEMSVDQVLLAYPVILKYYLREYNKLSVKLKHLKIENQNFKKHDTITEKLRWPVLTPIKTRYNKETQPSSI